MFNNEREDCDCRRNRNNRREDCDCRRRRNNEIEDCGCMPHRQCGICCVEKGIKEILRAIADIDKGLKKAEECEFCEAVRDVEKGLEQLRRGIRCLQEGLCHTKIKMRCKENRELEEILCDINSCAADIDEALDLFCCGDICISMDEIGECLDDLEEELKELQKIIKMDKCCKKPNNFY